jgi:hypothetical protein
MKNFTSGMKSNAKKNERVITKRSYTARNGITAYTELRPDNADRRPYMNERIVLEKDIEKKFCDWVEKQGGKTWKWTGGREKLDRIVLTHTGVMGLIEFKKPVTGRLSEQQKEIVEFILGIDPRIVCVCDDLSYAKTWYYYIANQWRKNEIQISR